MECFREDICEQVQHWAYLNIGPKFEFREHQLSTIVDIIMNVLNGRDHTQIIEAPTGSGKSLLNIISAGVLADNYGLTSYILVSDLHLWKQYDDFIMQHQMLRSSFGIIKGQTGNYKCDVNGLDMRNADCRMAGISWVKMFDQKAARELGYDCARTCKYVKARKKALKAKVVLMTYQLYHYMINIVSKSAGQCAYTFRQKDVIFCDECHNIPKIVSDCFRPIIVYKDLMQLRKLYSYGKSADLDLFDDEGDEVKTACTEMKEDVMVSDFISIFTTFSDPHATTQADWDAIKSYSELLQLFIPIADKIESDLALKRQVEKQKFTAEDREFYKACSWLRNTCCVWSDFTMCVAQTGKEYVIKTIEESRIDGSTVVNFSDVKEDFLSWYFLLSTARNQVMMSATVGGYDAFYDNVGLKYIEESQQYGADEEIHFTVIPSTFDFTKSPVLFLNRYKMSYANKEDSLKHLRPIIYKICEQFAGKKGMIQTGSYENAKLIYDHAPDSLKGRLLMYSNSREKSSTITMHQMSNDTILIGPTLVEGIDLPGDQCRFIIILKVPYPVVVDKYVREKMQLFPHWYNSSTSNTIIQGIGRGNRFREDYCTTYILDACFLALYNATKEQYPQELQDRIKIYR